MQINSRAHPRQRSRLEGRLLTLDGRCNFRCVVVDVSEGGARVSGVSELLPGKVFLFISMTSDIFECEIRWCRKNEIGLRFIDCAPRAQRKALLSLCKDELVRQE